MKELKETAHIKQELDYELNETDMTEVPGLSERVKQEQDIETHIIKQEIKKEYEEKEEDYESSVKKTQAASYVPLTFSLGEGYLYCEECQQKYEGDCPHHGPLIYLDNAEVQVDVNIDRQIIPGHEEVEEPGLRTEEQDVAPEEKMTNITEMVYKKGGTCVAVLTSDKTTESKTTGNVSGDSPLCPESLVDFCETQNVDKLHNGKIMLVYGTSSDLVGADESLTGHTKIHIDKKPHKCDDCGIAFKYGSQLKIHQRIHTGEKPYRCDVCGVGFKRDSHLKVHKRIHTGEKPYRCDYCGVGFMHRSHLKEHKRIHTGEKPYKCDICGVGFKRDSHMKEHKRVHTGEKPYRCNICGWTFAQLSHLKNHKVKHTEEKPYKYDSKVFYSETETNAHTIIAESTI